MRLNPYWQGGHEKLQYQSQGHEHQGTKKEDQDRVQCLDYVGRIIAHHLEIVVKGLRVGKAEHLINNLVNRNDVEPGDL